MNMKIEQSLEPISKETLLSLEQKFNFTFPNDYKEFLLKYNGGIPSHQYFSTMDGKIEEILSRFFPVSSNDKDNVVDEIEGITLSGQLPSDLIPIAITLGEDDRVVLAINGKNYGKVFHWAWSEENDNHNASYDYVHLVADSFDSFLEKLTEER